MWYRSVSSSSLLERERAREKERLRQRPCPVVSRKQGLISFIFPLINQLSDRSIIYLSTYLSSRGVQPMDPCSIDLHSRKTVSIRGCHISLNFLQVLWRLPEAESGPWFGNDLGLMETDDTMTTTTTNKIDDEDNEDGVDNSLKMKIINNNFRWMRDGGDRWKSLRKNEMLTVINR